MLPAICQFRIRICPEIFRREKDLFVPTCRIIKSRNAKTLLSPFLFRLATGLLALVLFGASGNAATIQVANTDDSGTGSLRQAILSANPGDTITFAPGLDNQLIRLTTGHLTIQVDLTIDASALPNGISISGDADSSGTPTAGDSRVFSIGSHTVVLRKLWIQRGKPEDGVFGDGDVRGGGISSSADLTMIDCVASDCFSGRGGDSSNSAFAQGGYGGGGGGIFNNGSLVVRDPGRCSIQLSRGKHARRDSNTGPPD